MDRNYQICLPQTCRGRGISKVSRKERHIGFENLPKRICPDGDPIQKASHEHQMKNENPLSLKERALAAGCEQIGGQLWLLPDGNTTTDTALNHQLEKFETVKANVGNNHPTVKPVALMDYLIKLVTPPSTPTLQRKVLDPFMGSGSTGMAAVALGHHFTGCELDPKYVAIAETRIDAWNVVEPEDSTFTELFTVNQTTGGEE